MTAPAPRGQKGFDVDTFGELSIHPKILQALDELGFVTPTPIQERVLPLLLEALVDLVGLAQTGTGKTAAFGIPLLQHLDAAHRKPQALVICPTRELCVQVASDLRAFAKHLRVQVVDVYGGASMLPQIQALQRGAHVVVATPGRLHDLIRRGKVQLGAVKLLVLDEADEMLNMGFQEDLDAILEQTPADKATLMFSATMPREVASIARKYMHEPQQVTVGQANAAADKVRHLYYMVPARDRYLALRRVIDFFPGLYGLVFCRTREETREVAEQLIADGYQADALHGDLSQAQRDLAMNRLRQRSLSLLVATDVAARGLDVSDLSHVINYNLPDELGVYTHRIGRTGRAGKAGTAITLIHLREQHKVRDLERRLKLRFEKRALPSGRQVCEKQLAFFAEKLRAADIEQPGLGDLLPAIQKQLEGVERDELLQRLVALEFKRLLEAYREAPDLSVEEPTASREPRRTGRPSAGPPRRASGRFARYVLNVGRTQGLNPSRLIGILNDATQMREIRIGRIEIQAARARFEADEVFADAILAAFEGRQLAGKKVHIEVAPLEDRPHHASRRS